MLLVDNSQIDSIQQKLQSIINQPKLIQIKEALEKTKVENGHSLIKQLQLLSKKQEDPLKTPSLKIQCNKHGKETIILNLNPEKNSVFQIAYVECIQSYDPIKPTTLRDTSFRWNEYLGQTSDQVKRFQNQRCLKSSQIIEILRENKEMNNSIFQKQSIRKTLNTKCSLKMKLMNLLKI